MPNIRKDSMAMLCYCVGEKLSMKLLLFYFKKNKGLNFRMGRKQALISQWTIKEWEKNKHGHPVHIFFEKKVSGPDYRLYHTCLTRGPNGLAYLSPHLNGLNLFSPRPSI